jgi:hypothetical protein
MNAALFYLWFRLLRSKASQFCRDLRRPATLIGFVALVFVAGFLFHFRRHEWVGHLVDSRVLAGGAGIMVFASLFKGFLQRGLAFDPPDIDFVFTSPFTQRQVIFYQLLNNYLFAVVQGLVFGVLFASHFLHPVMATGCMILFQVACFHLSTAASIYGGSLPEPVHHRLRWMMLGVMFLFTAFYLRAAWGLKLAPAFCGSPLLGLFFYPALTLPDVANAGVLHRWTSLGIPAGNPLEPHLIRQATYLVGFLGGALGTLGLLLRLRGDVFEPALATSARQADRKTRLLQGRQLTAAQRTQHSSPWLPGARLFGGVRAILWKNLLVARRSKRALAWVSAFALLYTGFTTALLYLYHHFASKALGGVPPSETAGFHVGIALFLAGLTLFLQRMVPFDFRHDGHHLLGFRVLPVSPLGLALAELSVPTMFCVALQAPCILALVWYSPFNLLVGALLVLAFPAVSLALNAVWNLHYLLAAAKRSAGQNVTAVGTLLVVAFSFLVFYPAGWIMLRIGRTVELSSGIQLPLAAGVFVQYLVDVLLVLLLANLFQRVQVSRDAT